MSVLNGKPDMKTEIVLRRAGKEDKDRILEISSSIWQGEDYVPFVIDQWLDDQNSEVIVAVRGGKVISFAHYVRLFDSYIWWEGIRTDPDFRNLGAARAIGRYFFAMAKKEGARKIGLSTYIENYASIHLIEAQGFQKVASFCFLEFKQEAVSRSRSVPVLKEVTFREAIPFMESSEFLKVSRGFLPRSWRFYPFWAGAEVLERMTHRLRGIGADGELSALLILGQSVHPEVEFTIDFLDGTPENMEALLLETISLCRKGKKIEAMLPQWQGCPVKALSTFLKLGFTSWNELREDIFVYELTLAS